jgi:Putative prokaryotic signal transducing protein
MSGEHEPREPRRDSHGLRKGKVIPFPAARRTAPGSEEGALVEVHRCDQAEAVVVRSLFESVGIPTVVRSHVSHAVHPFTVGQQGQAAILVPEAEGERSRRLLDRLRRRSSLR